MGSVTVGVLRERAPGECRVALVPEAVTRLAPDGVRVLVEPGAIVAAEAMQALDVEVFELCPWALREGVILSSLDQLTGS